MHSYQDLPTPGTLLASYPGCEKAVREGLGTRLVFYFEREGLGTRLVLYLEREGLDTRLVLYF